jgi:hypothetical protein
LSFFETLTFQRTKDMQRAASAIWFLIIEDNFLRTTKDRQTCLQSQEPNCRGSSLHIFGRS